LLRPRSFFIGARGGDPQRGYWRGQLSSEREPRTMNSRANRVRREIACGSDLFVSKAGDFTQEKHISIDISQAVERGGDREIDFL
jgi:hypothetical protein